MSLCNVTQLIKFESNTHFWFVLRLFEGCFEVCFEVV